MTRHEAHPLADGEVFAGVEHYAEKSEDLGNRFASEVADTLTLLKDFPAIGSPLGPSLRKFALRRFPYSIVYAERDQGLFVVALAHHRRAPGYWRNRV